MSARIIDQNGYITVRNNPISKSGVFQYLGRSIGAPDPDKIYNVYRPASEWQDEQALDSIRHVPLIDEHEMLGEGFTPAEEKGVHGITCDNPSFDGNTVKADLKIFSKSLAKKIASGVNQLSLGFRCKYSPERGSYDGQEYEYTQRNIRANHLAVVKSGRMGPDVVVLDHEQDYSVIALDHREFEMADEKVTVAFDSMELLAAIKSVSDGQAAINARLDAMDEAMKADKEAEDEAAKKAKEDAEKKEKDGEKGMDAAELNEVIRKATAGAVLAAAKEQSAKTELAGKISAYVGAFDHSEKTYADVAAYGREKLGLPDIGQDAAVLAGYFTAVPAPTARNAFVMDAAITNSAAADIDSFFSKGN
jgi:hypothetical protein